MSFNFMAAFTICSRAKVNKSFAKRKTTPTPIIYILLHVGKDSDAGRDWGQEEKGTTEDEMAGWHH